jgi:hypothetical protein
MGGICREPVVLRTTSMSLRELCTELQYRRDHRPPNWDIPAITKDALRREWLEVEIVLKTRGCVA